MDDATVGRAFRLGFLVLVAGLAITVLSFAEKMHVLVMFFGFMMMFTAFSVFSLAGYLKAVELRTEAERQRAQLEGERDIVEET